MKLVHALLISALELVEVIKLNWQSFKRSRVPILTNLQNFITTFHLHHRHKITL